jgi:outer membrane protein assembly factor BamB
MGAHFLLAIVGGLSFSAAQLDTTALWPMYGGGLQHPGRSQLSSGPALNVSVAWFKNFSTSVVKSASSPAVSSTGAVYTSGDGATTFVALDGATGAQLWSSTAIAGGAVSTPAISSTCLIVYGGPLHLTAVSCTDGSLQWQISPFNASAPFASPPAIVGDTVLAGCDDYQLYALNLATGQEKWRFVTESYVRSSPAVSADGSTLFITSSDWKVRT